MIVSTEHKLIVILWTNLNWILTALPTLLSYKYVLTTAVGGFHRRTMTNGNIFAISVVYRIVSQQLDSTFLGESSCYENDSLQVMNNVFPSGRIDSCSMCRTSLLLPFFHSFIHSFFLSFFCCILSFWINLKFDSCLRSCLRSLCLLWGPYPSGGIFFFCSCRQYAVIKRTPSETFNLLHISMPLVHQCF